MTAHRPGNATATEPAERRAVAIADLPAPEVATRLGAGTPVLLPMGSLETHGPALPMGDYQFAAMLAERIALAADALVLPALPFGGEDFFGAVPGAVALPPALLQQLLEAVGDALFRNGGRRLLILNGHGGSVGAVEAAQRAWRHRHGVVVPALHLWPEAAAIWLAAGGDPARLGHGAEPVRSVAACLMPGRRLPAPPRPVPTGRKILGLPPAALGVVRCGGVGFAVPMDIATVAPDGRTALADAPGEVALGTEIVARLVDAGVAMVGQLRECVA